MHFQNHSCVEFRIFVTIRRFFTDNTLQQNNEVIALNRIISGIVRKKTSQKLFNASRSGTRKIAQVKFVRR